MYHCSRQGCTSASTTASTDLCELNGVEFVIFQGSYRQQSLLVLYTERFNGNGGRCKQRNLRSDLRYKQLFSRVFDLQNSICYRRLHYLHVKQELSVAEGLIFSESRIVLPAALQRKVVKLEHVERHLGKTKTKQMLREKYWFPLINSMIDTAIDQWYECQVPTKGDREEPIKVTTIPNRPWDTVSIHRGGLYPDGHYNLVLIDKRTRYPVVESVPSTDFQTNKERLKHIFATYGTPRRTESDNRPPFNSKEFNEFARQEGFQHHRVTALHPRMNREVQRFMQTLNKTEQIENLLGKNRLERRNAVQDRLIAYRSTPHPATGVAPYEALKGNP